MKLDLVDLDTKLRSNLYNPQNIFKHSLDAFRDASNGEMVAVNATTPLVNLIMYMSTQGAISNDQIERASRRLLPEYANSISELAPHFDYATLQTIHATPSTVDVTLQLTMSEVMDNAVPVDGAHGYMIIPKESSFTYTDGTTFGLHHDIMLRVIESTTVDSYYLDGNTPLQDIEVPFIKNQMVKKVIGEFETTDLLSLTFPVYNFTTRMEYRSISESGGFNEVFTITNQLYHIRVRTVVNGKLVEFLTAYGDFKYDPNSTVPIIVVQPLADNTFRIKIPDVFITRGLIGSEISLSILETKGDIDIPMSRDGTYNMEPTFTNNDASIRSGVEALRKVINLGAYSDNDTKGGVDTPTLEELKNRVLAGTRDNRALSEAQLMGELSEINYTLGHELNYIASNVFTASTKISDYDVDGIGTLVGTANISVSMSDLNGCRGVLFPEDGKVVITPESILNINGLSPRYLTNDEVDIFLGGSANSILNTVNAGSLMSPIFYYSLDVTSDTALYSAFDLDNPTVSSPNYMDSNIDNEFKMATSDISIAKSNGSYFIYIVSSGNKLSLGLGDSDVVVQVSFMDEFDAVYSVNATVMSRDSGGNFLFRAELITNFNLGMGGTIEISNLANPIHDSYHLPLTSKMNINYVIVGNSGITDDKRIEYAINPDILPERYSVISVEESTVSIGEMLSDLFSPIKSIPGTVRYSTYSDDIIATYASDIYEMDGDIRKVYPNPDYDPDLPTDIDNSPIKTNKLHSSGDPILVDGEISYSHHKGDYVLDKFGDPMEVSMGNFNHIVSVQGLDYKFILMDRLKDMQYEIKNNLISDVRPIAKTMIQDTFLEYTVGNTTGDMEIIVDGKTSYVMGNEITMTVLVKVRESDYTNISLRDSITHHIKSTISKHLNGSNYYENGLVDEINDLIKSSVISFKIMDISGNSGLQSFQLANSQDSMGIKSILTINDAGKYEIIDGIDVKFISM